MRGGYFNNNINNIIQQLLRSQQHSSRSRKTTLHHTTQREALQAMGDRRGIKNSDTQSISEFLCLGFREALISFSC